MSELDRPYLCYPVMNSVALIEKALNLEFLTLEEGVYLYKNMPLAALMEAADTLRRHFHPDDKVTWIIDRNANTTNVCVANCKFCNFFRPPGHPDAYITTFEQYEKKIEEMFRYGGDQLLLQGGHHPDLGLAYYTGLFKQLKERFPDLKLHSLGPPEVMHICQMEDMTPTAVLEALMEAGLDSLPGAGAEILVDRVRRLISNGKCNTLEWLNVMRAAHKLGLTTSATMMFGHVETIEERFEHLVRIREVQSEKPAHSKGFIAFIPWPFQDEGTLLARVRNVHNQVTQEEYIRMISMSRLMLVNFKNIAASWLTVGKETAQICLHAGANDFGSIMIEENVVSAAGAPHRFTSKGIQEAIREAGFEPQLRTQQYDYRTMPAHIEEQVITY